jgi:hypothetical protein
MKALNNGGSSLGVTDRLVSVTSYAVDPCIQKAAACSTNKVKAGVSATTPGWGAGQQDYHKILNVTDAYVDWSDEYTSYNPARIVVFRASAVCRLAVP